MTRESQQPYAPPKSSLAVAGVAVEPPLQVQRAIKLLWGSFGLGVLDTALLLGLDPEVREVAGIILLFSVLAAAVFAFLIVFAARRRNWARILLLIGVLVTGVAYLLLPSEQPDPWWSVASITVSAILEIVAMVWLFTGPGARWYAHEEAE